MARARVAAASDLKPDIPVRVEVAGEPICLVHTGDGVRAIHDTCSHKEFSLAEGMVFDGQIECALHGSMFDLATGEPASLPATTSVPVFAVDVDGDDVYVDIDQQLNDAPIPNHG